jgi:hypothetical protein
MNVVREIIHRPAEEQILVQPVRIFSISRLR